jgi:hypothetical protein
MAKTQKLIFGCFWVLAKVAKPMGLIFGYFWVLAMGGGQTTPYGHGAGFGHPQPAPRHPHDSVATQFLNFNIFFLKNK